MKNLSILLTRVLFMICFLLCSNYFSMHGGTEHIRVNTPKLSPCTPIGFAPENSCMNVENLQITFPRASLNDLKKITFKLSFSKNNTFFSFKNATINISYYLGSDVGINQVRTIGTQKIEITLFGTNATHRRNDDDGELPGDLITAIMGITGIEFEEDICTDGGLENLRIHLEDINIEMRTTANAVITEEVLERALLEYCGTPKVQQRSKGAVAIHLTPNPAVDHCFLELKQGSPVQQIEVYDTSGKRMYETNAIDSQRLKLPIANWEKGIYLVKIQTTTGIETRKLLIQ